MKTFSPLDRQRRAAHRRRQIQSNESPEPQEPPEPEPEENKDESVAISRQILESELVPICTSIFMNLNKNPSKMCDSISYALFALFASVMRDIPTSIPDLIEKKLILAIIDAYSHRIPAEENYLRDILLGLNAIVLHCKGAEIVLKNQIIYSILQTLVKEEYGATLVSGHSESCEEAAKQLLSLYSQAEVLREPIVASVQNYFLGLYKQSEIIIEKLAEAIRDEVNTNDITKKQAVTEKCSKYMQSLKAVVNFIISLIQNEVSADHKKMLSALNEDCVLDRKSVV